ncbi:MAG: preprotein translocase subunit SecY [Ruminococcaceae bacterium]|nr:preprotein translocase subunit SecY [Oscillospiraceae bacterium]
MLQTLRNAWKIPELRKKMLYTLLLLVVFRLGSYIPVPGLSSSAVAEMMGGFSEGMQGLLNNFSGGALERGSIFAMSISPYINASIIIQLLTVAIPALERLSKEGEEGRKKISSYTRYGTVILGFLQATGLYFGLRNTLVGGPSIMNYIILTLSFTAGTAFLMWLGEEITEKGIGNGISLLIFTGIVSRGPAMIQSLRATLVTAEGMNIQSIVTLIAIIVVAVLAIAFVVLMNDAERRIPVQYAKRVVGRKMYGGQSTHIPIKVAMAGVMPIIFAISIMSFPQTINMFINGETIPAGFWGTVLRWFQQTHPFYIIAYFLLIVFFTYFYTAIQFNPIEISNNMKKNGGFVPGIRPGRPTSDFIARIVSKITLFGSLFLAVIALFPLLLAFVPNLSGISIGGTSLLIIVGVALETVKQMESQMLMRHYKGFLE